MPATRKAQWQIHFCVLLWGFTAILGKLITLTALALVWWRMLLVTAALLLLPRVWRGLREMPARLLWARCTAAIMWASAVASPVAVTRIRSRPLMFRVPA